MSAGTIVRAIGLAAITLAIANCVATQAAAGDTRSVTGSWETSTKFGTGFYELKERPDGTITGSGTGRAHPEPDGTFKWRQTSEIEGRRIPDGIQIRIRGTMTSSDGRRKTGEADEKMLQDGPDTLRQQGKAEAVWKRGVSVKSG